MKLQNAMVGGGRTTQACRAGDRYPRLAVWLAVGGLLIAAVGCGSPPTFEFDTQDLSPTQEEMSEFSLGKYTIPIPIEERHADKAPQRANRFQLDFKLHALVSRQQETHLADAWEHHSGKVRDRVIRVCRNASVDELQEPELETLKAHLMDAVQAQLGDHGIRQLLITEVVSEPL
jgi:flagellar basal body-associated protein FliL